MQAVALEHQQLVARGKRHSHVRGQRGSQRAVEAPQVARLAEHHCAAAYVV